MPLRPDQRSQFGHQDLELALPAVRRSAGLRLWEVVTGLEGAAVHTGHGSIEAAEFSPDGQTLIVSRAGRILQLWDLVAGHEQARRRLQSESCCVALTRDGRYVASGGIDGTVSVWDLAPALAPGVAH